MRPWRSISTFAFLFGACAGTPSPPSTTTTPAAAPPATEEVVAIPTLRVRLVARGAELSVDGAGCVRVPTTDSAETMDTDPLEVCADLPVTVTIDRLGGVVFTGGWAIPVGGFPEVSAARVQLEAADDVVTLGEGGVVLHPGPHTHSLGPLGFVHLPPSETPTADRLGALRSAIERLAGWLGPPRRAVLFVEGSVPAGRGLVGITSPPDDESLLDAWLEGPSWWRRGLAAHLASLAAVREGRLDEEGAYARLLDAYERHRSSPGLSPGRARGRAARDLGLLVAYCVDADLRAEGTSLIAELPREGAIAPGPFLAKIAHDHPEAARRHRQRAGQRGVLDLDRCLRVAGRVLVAREVPVVEPARLLGARGLDHDLRVTQPGPGPLRAGDLVQHVRGRAIREPADIVLHLHELDRRHRFSVSVRRGDRVVRTWLRMVRIEDDAPVRVRFRAEPLPDASPEASDPFEGGPALQRS